MAWRTPAGVNASHTGTAYAKLLYEIAGTPATHQEILGLQDIPSGIGGGTPNQVTVTTLADSQERSIPGIKKGASQELSFKVLHDEDNFKEMLQLDDGSIKAYQVQFPDGTSGAIGTVCQFNAWFSVTMDGASVDGVLTDTITLTVAPPSGTDKTFDFSKTAWTT